MAEGSKRERIIQSDVDIISALGFIKTPIRTLPTKSELDNFAASQFPVAAIVGGMPVPDNKRSSSTGHVETMKSILKVKINYYAYSNVEGDQEISNRADDIWKALYADPGRGKLCITTSVETNSNVIYWDPFVAFQMVCIHEYYHNIGGI